jgi:serine/threonine protein phosphatase 1
MAIGDIHGCLTAFESLLSTIDVRADDTLVTLGDYVDRGPGSKEVLEKLMALQNECNLITLRGNHEQMMLQARHDVEAEKYWRLYGGNETLTSYGVSQTLEDVPASHWEFLVERCVDYWESETHFFVHANAYADLPLSDQPDYMLFWESFGHPAPHSSGKIMVCGHTSQKSGLPFNVGHAVCIDTWVYGKGWLTCLDTQSGLVYQANQAGQQRQLWLNEV